MVDNLYYYQGEYKLDQPQIPFNIRGSIYGENCFETILWQNNIAEHLNDHILRLEYSLSALNIPKPDLWNNINDIIVKLGNLFGKDRAIIRITVFNSENTNGLKTVNNNHSLMICHIKDYINPPLYLKAIISSIRKNSSSMSSGIKSGGGYIDHIFALNEAMSKGADEAILLNIHGRPVCFTSGNLLIETKDNEFISPPPSEGCLKGITLKNMHQEVVYKPININDIRDAKIIYRLNSVSKITKVELIP